MTQRLIILPVFLALAACGTMNPTPAQDDSVAHLHIGHVSDGWQDTPDQAGLLPTAVAEADIAAQHAGFAVSRPDDLAWMQEHVSHVVHAIDPSEEPSGPGLGYGIKRAAQGVAQHVQFAAAAEDASDNVKLHAEHVATSAANVVAWSERITVLGAAVKVATSADQAAPMVREIEVLTQAIRNGVDADGDGEITWQTSEGGLAQAQQHMTFMRQGEGMV